MRSQNDLILHKPLNLVQQPFYRRLEQEKLNLIFELSTREGSNNESSASMTHFLRMGSKKKLPPMDSDPEEESDEFDDIRNLTTTKAMSQQRR